MYNRSSNAYALYQQNDVMTASRGKLLIMLYDGAIKFLRLAKVSMDEGDIQKTHNYIMRTQDIISEFMATLNMDYEISKSLFSLYDYMKFRLTQANINKDKDMLDEILNMLIEFRDTWEKAMA